MRLPFQPGIILPNFFPQYDHPILINYGDCFKWAWVAYSLFNDVKLWSHETHAFIKYRNRFYDSEALSGVKRWQKLRTIKENSGMGMDAATEVSAKEFIDFWSYHNKCDWSILNRKASDYKKYQAVCQ